MNLIRELDSGVGPTGFTFLFLDSESIELANAVTMIEESPNIKPGQKEAIMTNLKGDMEIFQKHRQAVEAHRHHSPWIQSTELSDNIADMYRLTRAISHSVTRTMSKFSSRVKRQQNNLLPNLQKTCKDLVSPNITCPLDDRYRSANGQCNNLVHHNFGAAGIAMRRFSDPAYHDGL